MKQPSTSPSFVYKAARWLYALSVGDSSKVPVQPNGIRVVCISDTHSHQDEIPPVPEGDILIHAGDLSGHGTEEEVDAALAWLQAQSHTHKIFIGGNHDLCLTDPKVQARLVAKYPGLTYLQDSTASVTVRERTLRIYGNAQTPKHGTDAFAFPRIAPADAPAGAARVWNNVPQDVDVLVTHGPPAHHLDEGYGCAGLLHTVWRVRPRLHVFGHIHTSRGTEHVRWTEAQRAFEHIASGLGGLADLVPIARAAVARVVSGGRREPELGAWIKGDTIMANVASRNRFRDNLVRGAVAFDI